MHNKSEDIFQCLNDFFTEYSIPSKKNAGICTNGAAACTGFKSEVVIFDSLNCLNLSMQGAGFAVIDHAAKLAAYHRKLILWKSYVAQMNTICSLN